MAFGGVIKLTGEKEYKQALTNINTSLREMSSQMSVVTSSYNNSDKSISALTQKNQQLNSILQKQKTDYESLKATYDKMSSTVDKQKDSHDKLQAEFDEEKSKLAILSVTLGTTSKEYQDQEKKLIALQKQLDESNTTIGQNENALSKMRIALNNSSTAINKTEAELNSMNNELEDTEESTKKAGDGFTVLKGVISNLSTKAITVAIDGLKKLGGAVINVGKQAVESYAEYEQLVGGVETLFKESAKEVEKYANNAYKSAGLSANQYMETVTSFSASLLQGLNNDTAKTAKIADLAITDMSDNANKMGTSMEMIQNAYQGFAKQNYTMLDNLKLGYGGTKTEMLRLVNDSKVLNKTVKSLDDVTFDQIIMAIHKVQENMGITGTTAKEAEHTIAGSVASMKSSWQNLLTGIANSQVDTTTLVKKFMDSVKTVVKNVLPIVKQSIKGLVDVAEDLLNELYGSKKFNFDSTKVVQNFEKAIKNAIDTISLFIKNKDKFVTAMKLMLSAFVVTKVASWTSALNKSITAIMNSIVQMKLSKLATDADTASQSAHTTAQIAGKTATEVLTAKQAALNAIMSANPIGLVITGITALISLYLTFKRTTEEVSEAESENTEILNAQSEAIQENIDSWDQLVESKQNAINTGMTEISNYQSLYKELQSIVDQNGKVKEGYEQRASFITSTLADALGIEIKNVNGVIENYNKLKSTIDDVMEKKKAQLILDSQESLYSEAINKQQEGLKTLIELETSLNSAKEKKSSLENELIEKRRLLTEEDEKGGWANLKLMQTYRSEIEAIQEKIKAQEGEVSKAEENYTKQESLLQQYAYNIGLYEQNMAFAHAGEYDKMSTVTWEYVKDYQEAGEAEKKLIEDQIATTQTNLDLLKEMKAKSNSDIYDNQIKSAENQLSALKEQLAQYNSVTNSKLNETELIWSDQLSDQLSTITGAKIEFKDAGDGNVEMYIDGVASGKKGSKDEMAKIVSETIKEVSKQETKAEQAGKDLIRGFNNGEANVSLQNVATRTAESFGSRILAKLKQTLGIASPSKQTKKMGAFLVEGLGLGIEKEEDVALKEANNFGKSVINSMNKGLSKGADTSLLNSITGSIPSEYRSSIGINRKIIDNNLQNDNSLSYSKIFNGFMEALSKMKIELDDENMGRFVIKTVTDEIYT